MMDLTPNSPSLGTELAPSRGEAPEVRARPLRPAYDPQSPYHGRRVAVTLRDGSTVAARTRLRQEAAMSPEAA